MKKIYMLFIATVFYFAANSQGTWQQNSTVGGGARNFASTFTIGKYIYISVGNTGGTTATGTTWRFNPDSNVWTQMADFGGNARWGCFSFAIKGKGYIGTGRDGSATSYNDFWEYDTTNNSWTSKASFPGGVRRGAAAFVQNNLGYAGMGWNGATYFDDIYAYNPDSDVWNQKASFGGGARNYPVGFSVGSKGYMGTGSNGAASFLNDFYSYDATSDSWTAINSFPGNTRAYASAFVIGQNAYVGAGGLLTAAGVYKDFWKYDTATGNWSAIADIPTKVELAVSYSINGKGYVATGDTNVTNVVNKIWEFDTSSIYTILPDSEICFGDSFNVDFNTGTLTSGNVFTAQLSDSSGDFTKAKTLGTMSGTTSGSFACALPSGVVAGTHYKIRVNSSSPKILGNPIVKNFIIRPKIVSNILAASSTSLCSGQSVDLYLDTVNNFNPYNTTIVLEYDATQGTSTLSGANKVYMHSGLADTNLTGTTWNNVVGNYGVDDSIGIMNSLGSNKWTITIDLAKYYNIGYDYTPKYIGMNFRNEDGSKTGRSTTNDDIYINIETGVITTSFAGVNATYYNSDVLIKNGYSVTSASRYTTSTSGKFYYTTYSGYGCSANSNAINVAVYEKPKSVFIANGSTTFCKGKSVKFSVDTSAMNYRSNLLTITYDATQGTSNLTTANKVYMHSGVVDTNVAGTTWKSTTGNYAQDDSVGIMQKIGGNLWQITIDVSKYYRYFPEDTLKYIAINFRNENASLTGFNSSGGDIYIDIKNAAVTSSFAGVTASYIQQNIWMNNGSVVSSGFSNSFIATDSGDYTLVANGIACTDTSSSTHVTVNLGVTANYNIANNTTQCENGNSFQFNDNSTVPAGTNTYNWDFGDGTSSSSTSPSHTFTNSGNFSVRLMITTSGNCIDSITQSVTILPSPAGTFSVNSVSQCITSNTFIFTDNSTISSGTIVKRYWDLGDGKTDSVKTVVHGYSTSDSFLVKEILISDKGCNDTSSMQVYVVSKPTVSVAAGGNTSFCAGGNVQLTATSSGSVTYQWMKNGVNITGATSATFSATDSASYTVVVSLGAGCVNTSSPVVVTVTPHTIVGTITGSSSVNAGSTKTYSVAGAGSYTWAVTGGTLQAGQGTNSISVLWGSAGTGNITAFTNCSDTSSLSVSITTGILSTELYELLQVYPNPSSNLIYIKTPETHALKTLYIYAADGKKVYTIPANGERIISLDISNLAKGIYHVEGISVEGLFKANFVVE